MKPSDTAGAGGAGGVQGEQGHWPAHDYDGLPRSKACWHRPQSTRSHRRTQCKPRWRTEGKARAQRGSHLFSAQRTELQRVSRGQDRAPPLSAETSPSHTLSPCGSQERAVPKHFLI